MLEYWLARFVLWSIDRTPRLAGFYSRLLDLAIPRLRRTALRNLEMARFDDRDKIVDGIFRSIARLLATFARFPRITRDNVSQCIRYDGLENFKCAQARGRGVLVATAHLGNWELSAFAHALMTAPMNIVVRPLDHARIDRLVEQRRSLSGNRIIEKRTPPEESCARWRPMKPSGS